MNVQDRHRPSRLGFLAAALAAWCMYIVCDFLINAVFLASYWRDTGEYWLPPRELFRMIPFGYVAFAIYCFVLTWLLIRLYGERLNLMIGTRFAAVAGIVYGIYSMMGLFSLFRMPASAIFVWPPYLALASTAAGAASTWVLVSARPWKRFALVLATAVALLALGVVVQNLFFPTPADHVL